MFDVCAGCAQRGRAYEIFDWCANCERSLCPDCMSEGCCGKHPTRSGKVDFKLSRGLGPSEPEPVEESDPPLPEHFGGRCCARARAVACSCAFHWVCPYHGDQHIGTHD